MRISLSFSLALSLLVAPVARAEGPSSAPPATREVVQPAVAPPAVRAPELKLEQVQLQEQKQDQNASSVSLARGSFWWVVGVIVVAGVILAVLL